MRTVIETARKKPLVRQKPGARRRLENVSTSHVGLRIAARQLNSARVRLGVKWSQVQMGASKIPVHKSRRVQPCRRNSRTDGVPTPGPSQLPGASPTPRVIFIDGSNREQFLASRCRSKMTHWHDQKDAILAGRTTDGS